MTAGPTYTIAVRALCEFTAKQGDLDLRFTPAPTAQEGMDGHAAVAARRGGGWRAELALAGTHKALAVRGRADGWDAGRGRLEEIKTYRGELDRMPANHRHLHWAQLKVYGALLCRQLGLPRVTLALVYFDIGTQAETVFEEDHEAAALQACFEAQCERFLHWAERELAHRAARDAALAALAFPHAAFRRGQRELAAAVYRAATAGRCLMAQAPTGIGKTVGTLFPLLKASPGQALDKVVFLTAKGTGRALALDALALILSAPRPANAPVDPAGACAPAGSPLRVLELTARDKACVHPDKACHGDSCPLAAGFYDRLPAARAAALDAGTALDAPALRALALQHGVCPYYLGQELARWADVLVGDYNHWFDAGALLHGLAQAQGWRAAVLVDEAHNLLERARAMYTAAIDQRELAAVRRGAPPALKGALTRLQRAWKALHEGRAAGYAALPDGVPRPFASALAQAQAAIADHLALQPAAADGALVQWYFALLQFTRVLERYDASHSIVDLELGLDGRHPRSVLCVRNLVPAPHLAPRWAAARTTTLFSATLSPREFHRDLLGLPADTLQIDVASPFDAAQLQVRVVGDVSTRQRDRAASLAPIADLVAAQYAARPGNYLAFFSSFEYLEQALAVLQQRHPALPVWRQPRGMRAEERDAFLARFVPDGRGIGYAVLGGAFAEGIDLPGTRLVGAFVATLGLPPASDVNEATRRCIEAQFGDAGRDYTYLYPGLQKVVQAAGRVIRGELDRGVVVLIDDRYARASVRRLLPSWWRVEHARHPVPASPQRAERRAAPKPARIPSGDRPAYSPGEGST